MIVGVIGYISAAGIFLVLLALLLIGRTNGPFKRLLALASAATALWAASAAYQATYGTPLIVPQLLELLRDFAWLTFLLHMLHAKVGEKGAMSTWLALARHGLYAVTAVTMLFALYHHFNVTELSFLSGFDFQLAGHLTLAIAGLVLLEHILRNTPADLMRTIKYLCFGIGGMFVYDFYLYSDALLFQRIDPALWEARGFINATVVPVIGVALARNPQWSPGLLMSRRIVFHTSALLGSGIYLLAMGVGGYYVRDYGGTWGAVAQTIFLFGAGLLLLILIFSGPLRARMRVHINKHFFHYKYDYREEWLRFIRTLSSNETDIPLPERAIRAIDQMIDSPGGVLWMRLENGQFEPTAKWNMDPPLSAHEPAGGAHR